MALIAGQSPQVPNQLMAPQQRAGIFQAPSPGGFNAQLPLGHAVGGFNTGFGGQRQQFPMGQASQSNPNQQFNFQPQTQVTRSAAIQRPMQYWPLLQAYAKMYQGINQRYGNQQGGGQLFGGFNPYGLNMNSLFNGAQQLFGAGGGFGNGQNQFGGQSSFNPYGLSY